MSNLLQSSPMQRDIELFQQFDLSQMLKPIFFFYTWDTPAITIGKIQRNRVKLIKEAEALGISCYLRPTGGRAVLHGGDICYTFIGAQSDPEFGGTLQESFKKVNERVIDLFNKTIEVNGQGSTVLATEISPFTVHRSPFTDYNCFSTHVSNEGLVNGHKIIGAAQAMGSRSFIQQGSIQINTLNCKLPYFKESYSLSELVNNGESLNLIELCLNLNNLV
jgi:lipoate-protein ligase A